jgi:hypothetical protein
MDTGVWRIRYKSELCRFVGGEDIVRFIKAQRIYWLAHVERMDDTAMPKRVLKEKLCKDKDRKTQIKMDG